VDWAIEKLGVKKAKKPQKRAILNFELFCEFLYTNYLNLHFLMPE